MDTIIAAFETGGIWMYFILVVSILVVGVSLERLAWLFGYAGVDRRSLLSTIEKCLRSNDVERAIKVLRGTKAPLARVLYAGVSNFHERREVVRLLMDEGALVQVPRIEKRTGYLVMLSNAATLLGLLGTIIGLIMSFKEAATASAGEKATKLAEGISLAMNSTAFGLGVAIVALIVYALLKAREHKLVDDINQASVALYNIITDVKLAEGGK
ncbi:MAG TPA: MotA/TolQ/ExbB proton channel family protein [Myxococcota bacterium]|nr:MotA/TolQ/ExbB proton channel family protein [Myxococcota bacterium]